MPLDLAALAAPAHTALVTQEIQRGVVGDLSQLPELAAAARPVLPNVARLVEAARAAGVPVIHCTAERRADGLGANANARIFQYMAKAPVKLLPGSEAAQIVPEVAVAPSGPRARRASTASRRSRAPSSTRSCATSASRTIVGVGVSVNVAIQNLAFDAVNASYQVVLPRDAVAGFPAAYVDAVFAHTLGAVATLCTTADLLAAWVL